MPTWIKNKRKLLGLSQEDVAESLGVSRPTYVKLESGESKPNEQQTAILASLFNVSQENLKDNSSDIDAVKVNGVEIREIPKENEKKFKEVLLYVLGKIGSRPNIGQTALYKILYFIDFDYYEKFEKQLIGATYIKNTYGPTPISFAKIVKQMESEGKLVEVKSKYFNHDQTKYIPVADADVSKISGQELKHIDDEIERLGYLTGTELSKRSHDDMPWLVAKDKQVINYEHVFYRSEDTSVRDYEPL
ncbi:MAG: type II toxin-antitoxin system antitoxin SocA domain-containing protein [Minisyncoccia bacterium]